MKEKIIVSNNKEKFLGLEWLRFSLGFYIMIYHTLHTYGGYQKYTHYFTDLGFISTSCFFILSGFLLSHVYLTWGNEEIKMRESPKSFMIKRLSNLYPIHIGSFLFFIAAAALISWASVLPYDSSYTIRAVTYDINRVTLPGEASHIMSDIEMLITMIMNIFLLQSWNPYYLTYNIPAWSISTLMFFYICFPLVSKTVLKIKRIKTGVVIINLIYLIPVILVVAFSNHDMPETGFLQRNPIARMPEFIAGVMLCVIYHRRSSESKNKQTIFLLTTLFACSILFASYILTLGKNYLYYFLHNGLLLIPQMGLVYLFAIIKMDFGAKMNKIGNLLGGASLPMFALHIPIFMIFVRVERVIYGDPLMCFSDFRGCISLAGDKSILMYPVYLLLTTVLCIFFQKYFVVFFKEKIQAKLIKKQ